MSSKGQKYQKYTIEEKERLVQLYNNEMSSGDIEREYGVSSNTIRMWKYEINHPKDKKKRGRPKSNEEIDYKERYEILKNFQAFLKEQREKR
jgi:transposase-like protein